MQGSLLDKAVTSKCLCSIFLKLPSKFKCFHFCYNFQSSLLWFILYLIPSKTSNIGAQRTSYIGVQTYFYNQLLYFLLILHFCSFIVFTSPPFATINNADIICSKKNVFYFQGTAYGNVPVPSCRQLCESLNFSSVL